MQKITVLCVGKLKEAFYEQAVKEYEKRLSRCCKLELLELPEQRLGDEPSEAEIRQALKKEAALVEQKLSKGGALIAMCIEGQEMSSVALSQKMQQLAARGASQLTFLIGSSFGLDEDLKKKADLRLDVADDISAPLSARDAARANLPRLPDRGRDQIPQMTHHQHKGGHRPCRMK